jgi:hypothetical protein
VTVEHPSFVILVAITKHSIELYLLRVTPSDAVSHSSVVILLGTLLVGISYSKRVTLFSFLLFTSLLGLVIHHQRLQIAFLKQLPLKIIMQSIELGQQNHEGIKLFKVAPNHPSKF